MKGGSPKDFRRSNTDIVSKHHPNIRQEWVSPNEELRSNRVSKSFGKDIIGKPLATGKEPI